MREDGRFLQTSVPFIKLSISLTFYCIIINIINHHHCHHQNQKESTKNYPYHKLRGCVRIKMRLPPFYSHHHWDLDEGVLIVGRNPKLGMITVLDHHID